LNLVVFGALQALCSSSAVFDALETVMGTACDNGQPMTTFLVSYELWQASRPFASLRESVTFNIDRITSATTNGIGLASLFKLVNGYSLSW